MAHAHWAKATGHRPLATIRVHTTVVGVLDRVLGVPCAVLHRVLGVLHRVLGVLRVLHRVLGGLVATDISARAVRDWNESDQHMPHGPWERPEPVRSAFTGDSLGWSMSWPPAYARAKNVARSESKKSYCAFLQ